MQIEGADARKSLGERVQLELRRRFGANAAKKAARITGADLRTARGWVEEAREPSGKALLAIIKELGRDGLLALFSPEVDAHEEIQRGLINELRQEASRLEARLRARGASASDLNTENAAAETPRRRADDHRVR